MQTQYRVFLNQRVTARVAQMQPAERRRFAEKIRFLALGIWEGGVLVKKLSGTTRKVLFEARLTKGDRLLFTLGKIDDQSAVYLWALVKHDDVTRAARAGFPDNAPFLDFPIDTEETIEELYLDTAPEQWHTQEGIEEKVVADYGPQKWNVLDDDEWERLLAAHTLSELDFHLYLSNAQYAILARNPPLLVSGTAGSGKTTIALYYLSRKEFLGASRLFVTYSPYLRDEASKLYRGLVKGNPLEDRPPFPDFLTIEELQRQNIDPHSPLQNPATFVGLNEFTSLIAAHPLAKNYDPELLWEEIRAILKGAMPPYSLKRLETLARELGSGSICLSHRQELAAELARYRQLSFGGRLDAICAASSAFSTMEDFSNALGMSPQEGEFQVVSRVLEFLKKKKEFLTRPLLSLEEYEFLGKKRAPNFIYDRKELYALATYYEKKREEQGLYDEIDLAKRALIERKRMQDPRVWDLVICDEIQDMTDVHLELLFDLCKNRDHVLFAGDERQTINPSGFRWEAVRARFFESGARVPEISRLSLNFRSTGAIVELGNALLDLKKTFVGAGKFEARESWKFTGKPPVVIEGIEEARILHIVRQSGTNRSILVRSPEEKRRLIAQLGTELVFTIQEAKGLEFDTVLLWKFIEDETSNALWSTMTHGATHGAPEALLPHLSHELNLLYTAIMRARSILTIYDGLKPSAVWGAGRLSSLVITTNDTSLLEESWSKASSPEEWNRQGEMFFARGYYAAAAECYRNAAHREKEKEARGWAAYQAHDYLHAAPLFEQSGDIARAAWCFEQSGELATAMALYTQLGDKTSHTRLSILALEREGRYAEAGRVRLKMGEVDHALEDWRRGGEYELLADYYKKKKDYHHCAHFYEKAGNYEKAVFYYKKNHEEAHAFELILARATGPGADPAAVEFLRKEADRCMATRRFAQAATLYVSLNAHQEAAEAYRMAGAHERAALEFSRAKMYHEAAHEYSLVPNIERALAEWKAYVPETHDQRLAKLQGIDTLQWKLIARNPSPEKAYNQAMANALFDEALQTLERGEYLNALALFIFFKEQKQMLECLRHIDDDMLALYAVCRVAHFTLWSQYRAHKARVVLDARKAIGYLSKIYMSSELTGAHALEMARGLVLLLEDILDAADRSMLPQLKNEMLFSLSMLADFCRSSVENLVNAGKDLLRLLARLRDYSRISTAGLDWMSRFKETPAMRSVVGYLDELALSLNDPLLTVCSSLVRKASFDPEILATQAVDESNWQFLSAIPETKDKVVAYLLAQHRIQDAAATLRFNRAHLEAAELLESNGYFKDAAQIYEYLNEWEHAFAIYTRIGDQHRIARMYEHKGDYLAAIELWKQLGFPTQVQRLTRKYQKTIANSHQTHLDFGD